MGVKSGGRQEGPCGGSPQPKESVGAPTLYIKALYPQRDHYKRAILFLSSSKILTPHPPLRPASVYPRLCCGGRTDSPGGEGGGVSIFWKTREIGLPSYNDLSTAVPYRHKYNQSLTNCCIIHLKNNTLLQPWIFLYLHYTSFVHRSINCSFSWNEKKFGNSMVNEKMARKLPAMYNAVTRSCLPPPPPPVEKLGLIFFLKNATRRILRDRTF